MNNIQKSMKSQFEAPVTVAATRAKSTKAFDANALASKALASQALPSKTLSAKKLSLKTLSDFNKNTDGSSVISFSPAGSEQSKKAKRIEKINLFNLREGIIFKTSPKGRKARAGKSLSLSLLLCFLMFNLLSGLILLPAPQLLANEQPPAVNPPANNEGQGDPAQPGQPADPGQPAQPGQPADQENPADSGQPNQPAQPGQPDDNNGGNNDTDPNASNQDGSESKQGESGEPGADSSDSQNNPESGLEFLNFNLSIDMSNIEESARPASVTVTILTSDSTVSAVSVDLSPNNNWTCPVSVENTGKVTFNHSATPGIVFTLSGDVSSGYVMTAQLDQGNANQGQDVMRSSDFSITYNPPQGEVAKPVPINKPGKKLLILNPTVNAQDRRTDDDKKDDGDADADNEHNERLNEAEERINAHNDNYIYYIIIAVFLLLLVAGMIVLRIKLK